MRASHRLRIFAGPNGSGKSTLYESFSKKYETGYFLNADVIEKELITKGFIDLNDYGLELEQQDLDEFLKTDIAQSFFQKAQENNVDINFTIKENVIVDIEKESHSYEGAIISAFLRSKLQKVHKDFCFETVMSHPSKIEEIKEAKTRGYKTYLYFICIDDPEVNISRVENRVEKGGHPVSEGKIQSRYYNTLENLIHAIEVCDKCYFFDNSDEEFRLIAKVIDGGLNLEIDSEDLPNWFVNYVLSYYS